MKCTHTGLAILLLTSSTLFSPVCLMAADATTGPRAGHHTHPNIVPHTIKAAKAFDLGIWAPANRGG